MRNRTRFNGAFVWSLAALAVIFAVAVPSRTVFASAAGENGPAVREASANAFPVLKFFGGPESDTITHSTASTLSGLYITPSSGPSYGGYTPEIYGYGFSTTGTTRVTFGGVDATHVQVLSHTSGYGYVSNSVICQVPAHAPGLVDVVVINPNGQSGTIPGGFTYLTAPPPAPTGLSVTHGPSTGCTAVTITGTDFAPLDSIRVTFGGVDASDLSITNPGSITCTAPPHAAGAVDVSVINLDGQSGTLSDAYTYDFSDPPTVTSVSSVEGPTLGGTALILRGTGFGPCGGFHVTFGGAEAHILQSGTEGLACETPPHAAGVVDVVVFNPDGQSATLAGGFNYIASLPPSPTSFSPTSGMTLGHATVTISGTDFSSFGTTRVSFGCVDATGVVVSGTDTIACVTPAHPAGLVDVVVINPDGQSGTLGTEYTYNASPPPNPTQINPVSGSTLGGTDLVIGGTDFDLFGTPRVVLGGMDATDVLMHESDIGSPYLTCVSPPHAPGTVDVTVINPDGQSGALSGGYTYLPPQITGLRPATGPIAGGTPVTLSGSCFGTSGVRVLFDGVDATDLTMTGDRVFCIVPPHAAGVVDVSVVNPDGTTGALPAAFSYRVPGALVLRVDVDNSSGVEDGSTWARAFTTIQGAIAAITASGQTGEVWVAEGSYTVAAPERAVVEMMPFCDLYGGFAGVETRRDQRDVSAHVCTIDGQQERACVYGADNARLDGFTITGGNGPLRLGYDSSWEVLYSGLTGNTPDFGHMVAVDNSGVSPTLANCTLTANHTWFAAVANLAESGAPSSPLVTECAFTGNTGGCAGLNNGALDGLVCKPRINHCSFTGNSIGVADIGYEGECSPRLARCTFTSNSTAFEELCKSPGSCATLVENCTFSLHSTKTLYFINYPGSTQVSLTPTLSNCTFSVNTHSSGTISTDGYSSTVFVKAQLHNCIVWNNAGPLMASGTMATLTVSHSDIQGGFSGTGNIASDPLFEDAAAGDFRLQSCSPCIDTGSADGAPSTDLPGVHRPQGAEFDMGAYEFSTLVIVPDLHGLTPAAAQNQLTVAQLSVGKETTGYDPAVPAGNIARQTPVAGAQVPQYTPVDLVVSEGPPPPVVVPDVVGMVQEAADAALSNAGLVLGSVTHGYSLTVPAGRVMAQSPAAGAESFLGVPVDLVISRGAIAVPDVSGLAENVASDVLMAAGLVLGTLTEQYSVSVPAGNVISQSVAAGTAVLPGTIIDLIVSKGGIVVPDVTGQTQSTAMTAITGVQLAVGTITEQFSLTVPVGEVISQSMAAGTTALPGTVIDLVVSKGGIAVPDVTGLTQGAATDSITDVQLVVGTITQQYSLTVPSGSVMSQSLAAGTQVLPGEIIDLAVSRGGIAVPSVTGLSQSAATAAIIAEQLAVGTITQQYSLTVPVGSVISQSVAVGTQVLPGAIIDLVVSRGGIAVPNVAGQTQSAATAAIIAAQLAVGSITQQYSLTVPVGSVISQSVAAGTPMLRGDVISLVVSRGAIAVPNVVGQAQSTATTAITGAQLAVGTITQQYSLTVPVGTVISQSMAAGTPVLPDTAVDLLVSRGGIDVPNVAGQTQDAATAAITVLQLHVGTVTEQYSITVPVGRVLSQSVAAGTQVLPGEVIDLVLSKGGVSVPNVTGMTQSTATAAITTAQLAVGTITEQYSITVPAGKVVSQSVVAGTPVLPGQVINLVLSKGAIAVPNVAGLTQSAATAAITAAQLAVGMITEQFSLTIPAGTVISQSVAAGTPALPGQVINLLVSRSSIAVPDVAGLTQSAATAAITGAQLAVGTISEEYSLTVPDGTVVSQSVAAGTPVLPGEVIDLVVSRGGIAVPNVVGQTQGNASAAITGAQLAVGTLTEQYSLTVPAGTVISQSVAAGTLVLPNAVIDLVVSKSGIAVPDVVNQAQGTAAAAITGAGLVVGTVRQRNSGTVPAGSVISQDPGAGTQVLPWSAVNLLVSLGPVIVAGEGEGEGTNANAAREQLAAAFASADKNGDQQLSFAEAAAVVPDLSQAVFDEIDTNEDGQLSPDELGADQGSGCAACQGGKGAFQPADWGARLSDLFLMSLALVGLAALRRL